MNLRWFRLLILISFLSFGPALQADSAGVAQPQVAPGRVVSVGDVHGSYDQLVAILREAKLLDEKNRWIGGNAVFVQTGDLMDRGLAVRSVMDFVIDLQRRAPESGGKVVALLGNHENFNLMGFLDFDSTPPESFEEIYAEFVDRSSEKRRQDAFKEWRRWQRRYPECGSPSRDEWLSEHPLGMVEYQVALSPEGRYGSWLRSLPVAAQINKTIYVHGGLSPDLDAQSVGEINERARADISRRDSDRQTLGEAGILVSSLTLREMACAIDIEVGRRMAEAESGRLVSGIEMLRQARNRIVGKGTFESDENGPLWFRGYALWKEEEGVAGITKVAKQFGVEHFVVGHTPQATGIRMRFDGKAFLIDTGMVFEETEWGRVAALQEEDGTFGAIYLDKFVPLLGTASPPEDPKPGDGMASTDELENQRIWIGADDLPLPFQDASSILEFLAGAEVTAAEEIAVGITRPKRLTLERGRIRTRAAFRYFHDEARRKRLKSGRVVSFFRDSFVGEVAAYELSRLLGMRNVPPAVIRKVDGQNGSVQLWIENAMMEQNRREQKIEPPDHTRFSRQMWDMRVFDNLINNIDRNQGNILIDPGWNLWLIDHTRTFGRETTLPDPNTVRRCSRALWKGLRELEDEVVRRRLDPHLNKMEIKALMERRDLLVELIEQRISELGESRFLFEYGTPPDNVRFTVDDPDLAPNRDEVE